MNYDLFKTGISQRYLIMLGEPSNENFNIPFDTIFISDIDKAYHKKHPYEDEYWPQTPPEVRKQIQEHLEQQKRNQEVIN